MDLNVFPNFVTAENSSRDQQDKIKGEFAQDDIGRLGDWEARSKDSPEPPEAVPQTLPVRRACTDINFMDRLFLPYCDYVNFR